MLKVMIVCVNCLKNVKKCHVGLKNYSKQITTFCPKIYFYFGVVADEVTDCVNWEQLEIVIPHVYQQKPLEGLIEYDKCDKIRGETIANLMIESLKINGTNISYCRSQAYDSAGNMAGKQNGAALNFKKKKKNTQNDRALYYHCASDKFNLALAKASRVPEIFDTVCLFQSLGRFFASSPKRQRLFEKVIQENIDQSTFNKIKKKIKPFC